MKEEEERRKISHLENKVQELQRLLDDANQKLAEERLAMVEERRTLTEQKMGLEREIKKQEKAAQDMILNKNRNNREKLVFGFKSKGAL
mmetsp:Transcript_23225/g.37857  ORF Transcript_23225/g.37857 Transcript_23225/m.37857 type:complete len:89 (+) Transcript_23225:3-269(+)